MSAPSIPRWHVDLAEKIHSLIRSFDAWKQFREHVIQWSREQSPDTELRPARRVDRDPACSPADLSPAPVVDGFPLEDILARAGLEHVGTDGLSQPESSNLLPIPDRRLTMAEKYAILSAVHDSGWKGEKVHPWPEVCNPYKDEPETKFPEIIERSDYPALREAHSFVMLLHAAEELPETDAAFIKDIIADVEADLRENLPTDPPEAEEKPHDGNQKRPKQKRGRKPDTDPENDRRIAEAWGTGQYRTYQELADARGRDESSDDIKRALDRNRKRRKNSR